MKKVQLLLAKLYRKYFKKFLQLIAMEKKPYHHLPDGTFRNPEGSPVRSKSINFHTDNLSKKKKNRYDRSKRTCCR